MTDGERNFPSELEQARAEIAALQARVAELEHSRALRILDLLPHMVYIYDVAEQRNVYANRPLTALLGFTAEQLQQFGSSLFATLMHPDDIAKTAAHHAALATTREGECRELVYRFRHADGTWRWLCSQDTVFQRSPDGKVLQTLGIVQDMTTRIEREDQERLLAEEQRHELVRAQEHVLRELGTPLIPIADEVIAMPLVGTIDNVRAGLILETLLDGIVAQHAAVAILDITGVKTVDAEVANALVRTAKAARLLGTEVILTGIGPKPAQTLVELGLELQGIITHGTFQGGIAAALGRVRRSTQGAAHGGS